MLGLFACVSADNLIKEVCASIMRFMREYIVVRDSTAQQSHESLAANYSWSLLQCCCCCCYWSFIYAQQKLFNLFFTLPLLIYLFILYTSIHPYPAEQYNINKLDELSHFMNRVTDRRVFSCTANRNPFVLSAISVLNPLVQVRILF